MALTAERIKKDTQDVCKKAKVARLQKSQTRDEKVEQARLKQWEDEESRSRFPRNILSETATDIQRQFGLFQEDFHQNHAHHALNREEKGYTFSVYKSLLRATFDDAWEEELEKPIREPTSTEGTTIVGASQADLDTKDLRKVTLPLSRIVRKNIFIEDLDETLMICMQLQGVLTDPDHTTSLYHKAQEMLEVNGDTLDLATKIQKMLDQLQVSTDLPTKIRSTLETTQTKLSQFMENVSIGAYNTTLWQRVKNEIQQKSRLKGHGAFLSQDYLQYLGARMPGCRDTSNWNRISHADWNRDLLAIYGDASPDSGAEIDVELDDPVALNKNVTNISNTLMREYATTINNIWDGPIYQQLRRYVVRYVLRINLCPISESNYRENKRQRAIDKAKQRKLEKEAPARASHRVSGGMEYVYESDSEFDESDSEDGDCGDDQETLTGVPNEPTSRKLTGLEAVAIKLLDSVTDAMVRNELYEPELYTAEEIGVVARVVTLLCFAGEVLDDLTPMDLVATRMSQSHRDAIFSAFLDRNVIDEACLFVDRYTVRIQGCQITSGTTRHVMTSAYDDKRKKKQRPPGFIDWDQELSTSVHTHASAKTEADRLKVGQEALLAKLKPLQKRLRVAESDQRGADTVFRKSESADKASRTVLYEELQSTRADVQSIRKETTPLESRLRTVKKHRNYYNRLSKATTPTSAATPDERTPQTISRPTARHPGLQDFVKAVCLTIKLMD
ncbi:hypothetical protein EC957_012443 [Mortierella hygrophila]|uniref:Uncharacterized protein n=1 Tax=Mortierella hygrophila TaxID=979708 RepID=A0A9P6F778_9FUNG|nr:hypothetical protein EC957_012443 [Mortierella hygrophila]